MSSPLSAAVARLLPVVCLLLCGALGAQSDQSAGAGIAARDWTHAVTRLDAADRIKVDGFLDEPIWQRAAKLGAMTQVRPVEGVKPTQKTEVRVCYDEDYFYLSLVCHDDPEVVRARLMTRDARLDPDDRVEFWIDTFYDRRFAFWFQIGAGGSRGDALISSNGDRFNKNWDGIWYGRSRVTERGWEAEVALPFKTLAFKEGNSTWGFNVVRHRKESNEEIRWAQPYVAYGFFRISQGGSLTGLRGMKQGLGIDVVPYATGATSRDRRVRDHTNRTGEFGGEVYYRISPELRFVLTYNTDFAETEVDERQVNLTRFPLFFPEKRDFFLEDSGLFEFGLPSGRSGGSSPIAFFSRRIGLDANGGEVPILAGAKLTGRVDNFNIGALGSVIDRTGTDEEKGLGVVRASYNLARESSIGMVLTGGRPEGAGQSATGGVDLKLGDSQAFGPGRALNFWAYWMGTTDDGPGGDGDSYGARAELRTAEWLHRAQMISTSSDFDPELGFVRRTGQNQYSWTTSYTWRGGGFLQLARTRVSPTYRTFTNGLVESWNVNVNWFDLEFEAGDALEFETTRGFERLPSSFEIRDGITVQPGDFTTTRHELQFRSSERRLLAVSGGIEWGGIYNGDLMQYSVSASVRPNAFLQASADYRIFDVDLDEGAFTTRLYQGRLDVSFTPEISFRTLVQYDSASKSLSGQARFRWIVDPGSDVFLLGVYGWEKEDHFAPLVPTTQDTTIKVVHTLRF